MTTDKMHNSFPCYSPFTNFPTKINRLLQILATNISTNAQQFLQLNYKIQKFLIIPVFLNR